MDREQIVFVKTHLRPGSSPTEVLFRVTTPVGSLHGIAPLQYCYTPKRSPLTAPPPKGGIDGLLLGVRLGSARPDRTRVYLPDGEVYDVDEGLIYPLERPQRVPLES